MAIVSSSSSLFPLYFRRSASPPFPLGSRIRQVRRKWRSPVKSSLEKEETRTEIDQEKAREALRQLDQQIQSLSQSDDLVKKRIIPDPPTEEEFERNLITRGIRGEMPEISDSYLAYTAIALVLLTIFNNFVFYSVIKPSVDGYEKVTKLDRIALTEPK